VPTNIRDAVVPMADAKGNEIKGPLLLKVRVK